MTKCKQFGQLNGVHKRGCESRKVTIIMEDCKCKIPEPQIKVSENGINSYCKKCCKNYKSK